MRHIEQLTTWIFAIIWGLAMIALFNAFAKYIGTHGL